MRHEIETGHERRDRIRANFAARDEQMQTAEADKLKAVIAGAQAELDRLVGTPSTAESTDAPQTAADGTDGDMRQARAEAALQAAAEAASHRAALASDAGATGDAAALVSPDEMFNAELRREHSHRPR